MLQYTRWAMMRIHQPQSSVGKAMRTITRRPKAFTVERTVKGSPVEPPFTWLSSHTRSYIRYVAHFNRMTVRWGARDARNNRGIWIYLREYSSHFHSVISASLFVYRPFWMARFGHKSPVRTHRTLGYASFTVLDCMSKSHPPKKT
jgi:hypothetical protein